MSFSRPVVAFYQMRLFHYRIAFFEQLAEQCSQAGIGLRVVAGQASRSAATRKDEASLPWVDRVRNLYIPIEERKDLCWQPTPKGLERPDLVLLMQENRLLSNYPWLLRRLAGGPKVAYWGHGRDLQAGSPDGFRNRVKKSMTALVDWYFGYTDMTRRILQQDGFPDDRVTVVNNAIDMNGFRQDLRAVTDEDLSRWRTELDLPSNGRLALYCGSLYADKRLDLLLDACDRVNARYPEFRLAVVGDGPERPYLEASLKSRTYAKFVGVRRGRDKACLFRLAEALLNPGGVGLHVLDAFAAGIPLLTCDDARHGPEVVYLENLRNGIATPGTSIDYSGAIMSLLADAELCKRLGAQASEDANRYSVELMAKRFVQGMEQCLSRPRRSFAEV